jgi:hypothetical protein
MWPIPKKEDKELMNFNEACYGFCGVNWGEATSGCE